MKKHIHESHLGKRRTLQPLPSQLPVPMSGQTGQPQQSLRRNIDTKMAFTMKDDVHKDDWSAELRGEQLDADDDVADWNEWNVTEQRVRSFIRSVIIESISLGAGGASGVSSGAISGHLGGSSRRKKTKKKPSKKTTSFDVSIARAFGGGTFVDT